MIYTYAAGDPPSAPIDISVDSDQPFSLSIARHILNLSQSKHVVLVYSGDKGWWQCRDIGKLFDFLGYRGADIVHTFNGHITNHVAHLSARLEKLYDESILDEWAQV